MEKEKSLSEKINWAKFHLGSADALLVVDVREAVKRLKEFKNIEHDGSFIAASVIRERIDEIFGEKLSCSPTSLSGAEG